MRFMMLVKHAENQGAPPKEFLEAMAKITEEAANSSSMLGGGGLAPMKMSTRVRVSDGEINVIDGPFSEAKEVVGGFGMFEMKSKEEAVQATVHFMELHKKFWPGWVGETEVRQILGPVESMEKFK
jgi:hypothetical protein